MSRNTFNVLVLSGVVLSAASVAHAQPPGATLTIQPAEQRSGLIVVDRSTTAVNYRPRQGETKIDFVGTALLPGAKGTATVSGEKGYMRIDARFDKLQPPNRFGREYLTYVLWAVTPEGRAKNLGEVQYDDSDARLTVTTDLQAFGLLVTAEPYFAVTQPSDLVVLENVARDDTKGRIERVEAKYQAVQRGTYLMNREPELKVKPIEPGAPLDLAEARNALELARLAGADKFASEPFTKATALLAEAEQAREKKKKNDVMMAARQAVQTAEEARMMALERREQADLAAQQAASAAREREALERARTEEVTRRQAERIAELEQQQRRQAELDAQQREAARTQAEQQARDEQQRRQQAELEALQRETARVQSEQQARIEQERRERAEADARAAQQAADQERRQAEEAKRSAEAQALQARQVADQAERDKEALRQQLREQLNALFATRETARGLIVSLSDVLFDTGSANLTAGAREKLARVAGIIASHPGLNLTVEGHTDNVGTTDFNQGLSEQRAHSVQDYLVRQGVPPASVGTAGFGESQPVASNTTAAGRQQNRRVELIVAGEAIGR
ncbi:MAG TPA: OmpA family protein [Vicinamibacterales bacterium]|nr:OmpA family protein [Vicinamibacterales bacterium]